MFLTNLNSSVEFAICLGIPSDEGLYDMETGLPIYNTNQWTGFCMVGDFSRGYSQADCHLNFNININVTVDSYMSSSFNFTFSQLLKDLIVFRTRKLESTSKITSQIETILQCLYFFSLLFIYI